MPPLPWPRQRLIIVPLARSQSIMEPPASAEARILPEGEHSSADMYSVWPGKTRTQSPVAKDHMRTDLSA